MTVTPEQLAAWQAMANEARTEAKGWPPAPWKPNEREPDEWGWLVGDGPDDDSADEDRQFMGFGDGAGDYDGALARYIARMVERQEQMANAVPDLLAEVERLTAEVEYLRVHAVADETTGLIAEARAESAAWAVEGAELRAEVHRLTAFEQDASFAADEIAALRADLGHVEPAEEPDAEVLAAPHRCDCCSTVIEPGDSAVMFTDETGRACWAHYAACPAPALCRVTYDYNGEPRTTGDISEQQAIYFGMAMNVGRAAGIASVRLVRCKVPRNG